MKWLRQAEQLRGPEGEIARMYLSGRLAHEYTARDVAAAMRALGIDCDEQDVKDWRNRKPDA